MRINIEQHIRRSVSCKFIKYQVQLDQIQLKFCPVQSETFSFQDGTKYLKKSTRKYTRVCTERMVEFSYNFEHVFATRLCILWEQPLLHDICTSMITIIRKFINRMRLIYDKQLSEADKIRCPALVCQVSLIPQFFTKWFKFYSLLQNAMDEIYKRGREVKLQKG